jgi:hypothetical protein
MTLKTPELLRLLVALVNGLQVATKALADEIDELRPGA